MEETLHLTTRAWQAQEPLPNDKEALDSLLQSLQQSDSTERDLSYLALASRYDVLYRNGKLRESEATEIWGFYGLYYNSRHYHPLYHQCSAQLAAPALRAIRSTRTPLKPGQVAALSVTIGAFMEQKTPSEALQLLDELQCRLPSPQRSSYHYQLARILEDEGLIDTAVQQWQKCLQAASDSADFSIRQQHFVAMLCRHGRYTEAARQLAPSLPSERNTFLPGGKPTNRPHERERLAVVASSDTKGATRPYGRRPLCPRNEDSKTPPFMGAI